MYADRYGPKHVDRGSLTLSVGIVGGLVAIAMLSPTVIEHVRNEHVLRTYIVPEPTKPPPPDPQPKTEPLVHQQPTRIDPPLPIIETPPVTDFRVTPLVPVPIPGPGVIEGPDSGVVIDPPRPPQPVLVAARPDARVDFQPTYPAEERRAGNEGVVTLRVLIGVDGRVRQVERVAAASEAFWRVTQDRALSKWRFSPATRDGVPYEVWRTMTVRFRLEVE
ncbi:energy transducer TonB [Sphingomonas sp.]|uniref:energy transducer TonB n=1 Tax=Sphingomonas sp. TaxID=28214 RepID=UPI003B00868C